MTLLPEELDSFVGREDELETLASLVVPGSGSSLVTLTGPGGSGKSRLGLRLAHHVEGMQCWEDGVGWVWLRPVRDRARLADHLATSLGIQQATNTAAGIIDALRKRRMLLVLDNCEHLHAPLRQFIAALLRAAPDVTVLATSRSSMDLTGENVHRLAPLSTATGENYQDGKSYDAAELFIHRARQVNPGFDPDGQYRTIVELCHQLDGLPLAVELCARRTQTYSLNEIAARRFDLLNAPLDDEHDSTGDLLGLGTSSAVDRDDLLSIGQDDAQRARTSLDNVLRWSWDLCTRRQQHLLQRLSVFPDAFDLEQAEVVCADDELLPRTMIAPTLDDLQRQSLVQRQSTALDEPSQFRLLDTIRTFAEHRLRESGQAEQFRHQHYEWVTQEFARVGREWLGPQEVDMLVRCRGLLLDVYAALDHCHDTNNMEAAFRLLNATFAARIPWFGGALPDMSRQWARLLERYPHRDNTRAVALASLAYLEVCRGLPADIPLSRLDEAHAIAAELDVELLQVQVATAVSHCFGNGDAQCVELMAHAYSKTRAQDPTNPGWAMIEMWWSICAAFYADTDTAEAITQQHLQTMTDAGAEHALGWARWARSVFLVLHCGDDAALAEAEELMRAGIATASRTGDRWIPIWWAVLAAIRAAKASEHARAAELSGIVASLTVTTGIRVDRIAGLYPALRDGQDAARVALGEEAYLERWHSTRDQSAGNYAATVELLTAPVRLTSREYEIVTLVVDGYTHDDIASTLHIEKESVKRNMRRVYSKTGCRTRAELQSMVSRSVTTDGQAS
ncbi:LuxR C-terminal-related transcriptional regulator [Saccharopolyspora sp. ID03-671]|uniref:helix-turn-helix transcriptional regulator n=1 Tax=Saccharopolyspora sp. ID03-671 TaxID=3073066 RepID=UPI003246426A